MLTRAAGGPGAGPGGPGGGPGGSGSARRWRRSAPVPFGLARVVPPRLLGFAVLSVVTFGADLALLTALHGGLRLPLAASITLAYAAASGLAYALNRALNFRSHAAIGPQVARYAAVVVHQHWP